MFSYWRKISLTSSRCYRQCLLRWLVTACLVCSFIRISNNQRAAYTPMPNYKLLHTSNERRQWTTSPVFAWQIWQCLLTVLCNCSRLIFITSLDCHASTILFCNYVEWSHQIPVAQLYPQVLFSLLWLRREPGNEAIRFPTPLLPTWLKMRTHQGGFLSNQCSLPSVFLAKI